MIRDEFIKQQKDGKTSLKAMQKIRSMGERAYYVTEINKLTNLKKSFNFSAIILGVLLAIVTVTLIVAFITYKTFVSEVIVPIIILAAFWIIFLLWFAVFTPLINKKIKYFTVQYEKIKKNEVERQKIIYDKMNK